MQKIISPWLHHSLWERKQDTWIRNSGPPLTSLLSWGRVTGVLMFIIPLRNVSMDVSVSFHTFRLHVNVISLFPVVLLFSFFPLDI